MATVLARMPHERRAHQRFPTRINARLVSEGRVADALICDISEGGALLKSSRPLPVRSKAVLKARRLNVAVTVVWASALAFGVRFDQPVKPLEIVRHNYEGLEHLRHLRSVT